MPLSFLPSVDPVVISALLLIFLFFRDHKGIPWNWPANCSNGVSDTGDGADRGYIASDHTDHCY